MRPWLKNKPQNTENKSIDQIKNLLDIIQEISSERNNNAKSRQSIRGELIFEKILDVKSKLEQLQKNGQIQEEIQDHFCAYISYLINLYVNIKEDSLEQQFVSKLMLLKMKIQWKSNKFFSIIDENNEFLVLENRVVLDENNTTIKLSEDKQKAVFKIKKQDGEEIVADVAIQQSLNVEYEIHRLLEKKLSINESIYYLYESFDIKQSQKYYMAIVPLDQKDISSNNSQQNFFYHIYLSEKYPQNVAPILKSVVQLSDSSSKTSRLVYFIQKSQCTLSDIIKERSLKKCHFTEIQMKKIFKSLVSFLLELKQNLNVSINDFSTENLGYFKNTDSYQLVSLDLLTTVESELVGKVHSLPAEYFNQYTNNETNKFNHYHNTMYQLASTLLQVYNLREKPYEVTEIEETIKQLGEKDKINGLDDFLKVIFNLFKYDSEKIKSNLNDLLSNEQVENKQEEKKEGENELVTDSELSKKINEKLKKKKKPLTLSETLNIAFGYYDINSKERAIKAYSEFIAKSQEENNSQKDTDKKETQKDIIFAYKEISQIYLSQDNIKEAINSIKAAAQLSQQYQLLDELKLVSYDWNEFGKYLQEKGQLKEQINMHKEILNILEQNITNPNDPSISITLNKLGAAYKNVGDFKLANEQIERAYEIDKKLYGNNSLQMAVSLHEVGTIQLLKGKFTEAICNLEKSLDIKKEKLKQNDPEIARGLNNLAEAYRGISNNKKALELFDQALTIFKEANLLESQEVSPTLNNIGIILYQSGEHDKGIEHLEKALKIEQKVLGESHANNAQTMFNLMIMLQKINKIEEAVQYGSSAYRIFLNIYPAGHPTLVQCNQVLTFLASKLKDQ